MKKFDDFAENAKGGDFNFGSNTYGWFDPDDPNGLVFLQSHNQELFAYRSLKDCYQHYVEGRPVVYGYACLLAERKEDGSLTSLCEEFDALKNKGVSFQGGETELWSELTFIQEPCLYTERQTPVCYNGVCI